MANYFVDCYRGSDAATGTSWATAWRTLDKAYATMPNYGVCYIAPGFYQLVTRNKPAVGVSRSFVGLGGVVVEAATQDAGLPVMYHGSVSYYNMVFKENAIYFHAGDAYNNYYAMLYLTNCDLHNGCIAVDQGPTPLNLKVRYCTCEGAFPPLGTISSDYGPFKVLAAPIVLTATQQGYYIEHCIYNKTPNAQGFIPNNMLPEGAATIIADGAQYNSAGTSFRSAELLPIGVVSRFAVSDTVPISAPQQAFSTWLKDPTGPAGELIVTDNYGITLAEGDGVRTLSPVFRYSMGLSLTCVVITASEFSFNGLNQVIDSTPADATRTLEYRVSDTPFTQTELSPAWNTVTRNVDIPAVCGKYFQFRITFNLEAM